MKVFEGVFQLMLIYVHHWERRFILIGKNSHSLPFGKWSSIIDICGGRWRFKKRVVEHLHPAIHFTQKCRNDIFQTKVRWLRRTVTRRHGRARWQNNGNGCRDPRQTLATRLTLREDPLVIITFRSLQKRHYYECIRCVMAHHATIQNIFSFILTQCTANRFILIFKSKGIYSHSFKRLIQIKLALLMRNLLDFFLCVFFKRQFPRFYWHRMSNQDLVTDLPKNV